MPDLTGVMRHAAGRHHVNSDPLGFGFRTGRNKGWLKQRAGRARGENNVLKKDW